MTRRWALIGVVAFVAAVGSAWFFIAHREPALKAGAIVAKGYDPPRDWIFMEPIPHEQCLPTGKTEDCITIFTYIPIPEHDPEQWWIRIKACGEMAGRSDSSCRTRDVIVSHDEQNRLSIGRTYVVPS